MLRELIEIYKIISWHKKTFPKYTAEGQQIKLRGEAYELIDAFDRFTKRKKIDSRFLHKRVEEETADVIIASINAMRFKEVRDIVKNKMENNRKRKWKGGQHER